MHRFSSWIGGASLAPCLLVLLNGCSAAVDASTNMSDASTGDTGTGDVTPDDKPIVTPRGAKVFAVDHHVSGEVVAAGGDVVWVERGEAITDAIVARPIAGGAAKKLYSADPAGAAIEYVAADATNLYWVEVDPGGKRATSTLKAMPLGGGTARVLLTDHQLMLLAAVDGDGVYVGGLGRSLLRVSTEGGPSSVVASSATDVEPLAMAGNDQGLCWSEYHDQQATKESMDVRCRLAGATGSTLVAAGLPCVVNVAVAKDRVVWATDGAGCEGPGSVSTAPMGGGEATSLATGVLVESLATDTANVYFVDGYDPSWALDAVPLAGGATRTLASALKPQDIEIYAAMELGVSAGRVYWADPNQGAVFSAE